MTRLRHKSNLFKNPDKHDHKPILIMFVFKILNFCMIYSDFMIFMPQKIGKIQKILIPEE